MLHSFAAGADGAYPSGALIQGTDGDLYGTTQGTSGGVEGYGTVFKISPGGVLTTLYSFCSKSGCTDGSSAVGGLAEGPDGDFYGTANNGGANAGGTVFKITPGGTLTTLYNFCSQTACADGENPAYASLVYSDGYFYGTTQRGGGGAGTIFKINPSGVLTTLHNFCSEASCADGGTPEGSLLLNNGSFYGATAFGGANQQGVLFQITKSGTFKTLYSFCSLANCADGTEPIAGLVYASDGSFYGTTSGLGHQSTPYGTIFRISPTGSLTTMHVFNYTDGSWAGSMIQATDGNLYGTTWNGGSFQSGTLFEITLGGTFTTLYDFCATAGCPDGQTPISALLQDTNGNFYGTAETGGTGYGTVFSLSAGLGSFVESQPTAGKVQTRITILGNNLTGTTAVSFNGTAAKFKVLSASEITTMVPNSATSGFITVTTPGAKLKSNVPFRVVR